MEISFSSPARRSEVADGASLLLRARALVEACFAATQGGQIFLRTEPYCVIS
jgi:hypothetical protein